MIHLEIEYDKSWKGKDRPLIGYRVSVAEPMHEAGLYIRENPSTMGPL